MAVEVGLEVVALDTVAVALLWEVPVAVRVARVPVAEVEAEEEPVAVTVKALTVAVAEAVALREEVLVMPQATEINSTLPAAPLAQPAPPVPQQSPRCSGPHAQALGQVENALQALGCTQPVHTGLGASTKPAMSPKPPSI